MFVAASVETRVRVGGLSSPTFRPSVPRLIIFRTVTIFYGILFPVALIIAIVVFVCGGFTIDGFWFLFFMSYRKLWRCWPPAESGAAEREPHAPKSTQAEDRTNDVTPTPSAAEAKQANKNSSQSGGTASLNQRGGTSSSFRNRRRTQAQGGGVGQLSDSAYGYNTESDGDSNGEMFGGAPSATVDDISETLPTTKLEDDSGGDEGSASDAFKGDDPCVIRPKRRKRRQEEKPTVRARKIPEKPVEELGEEPAVETSNSDILKKFIKMERHRVICEISEEKTNSYSINSSCRTHYYYSDVDENGKPI